MMKTSRSSVDRLLDPKNSSVTLLTKAVNLPLKLAVALLSDANGVIDLDFVVEGDLNDPEFKFGGIIWKVLKNIIAKTVGSPLTLLAGLVGGGENLDVVAFLPGSDMIEGIDTLSLR